MQLPYNTRNRQRRAFQLTVTALVAMTWFFPAMDISSAAETREVARPSRIEIVEKGSGWPVPLVQLRTVNNLLFVSDNAGVIVIDEPDLMNREVFFHVEGHGYEVPADGFGYRGVRLTPQPGKTLRIEVTRTIIARRLGRLTGTGLFAESQAFGSEGKQTESGIVGCDSVQTATHNGRHYWLWGDTSLSHYPLGIFHSSSATTGLKPLDSYEPPLRLQYEYFRGANGRPRGVAKMPGDGPTWLTGYVSLPDETGSNRLVASYEKIKPPLEVYEWGLCVWNEQTQSFEHHKTIWKKSPDAQRPPLLPKGHPVFWDDSNGESWVLFGDPFPTLRCRANFAAWQNPDAWEPIAPQKTLRSAADGKPVTPHRGSIAWNPTRERWVTVFTQSFGEPSAFGELWYAEADAPIGPWGPAVKILSHNNYTFYNPRMHPEFTPDDASFLLFEGTYTAQFAVDPHPTPRYDYNQILYRLDLNDDRLEPAQQRPQEETNETESEQNASTNPPRTQQSSLKPIRVSDDGTHFVRGPTAERFVIWGVNYDHDQQGRLLDEYWIAEWATVEEDLRKIKALGANCVRIHLQLGKFMDAPDRPSEWSLAQLAKLVALAEEIDLYLNVTGLACYHKKNIPAWYDRLSEQERWNVQAGFWEAVAEVCAKSPAIFCYDLMNEPILPGKEPATEWLAGELGGKFFVQRLALDLAGRSREQIAEAWVEKMTAAIRKHDEQHMITVGVIPWVHVFGGGKPLFHAPPVGDKLDFAAIHMYPESGKVKAAIESLAAYDLGKPLVIEEMFPLKCSIAELKDFIERSGSRADGWISFYWGQTPAELREKENPSLAEAITAKWLQTYQEMGLDREDFAN